MYQIPIQDTKGILFLPIIVGDFSSLWHSLYSRRYHHYRILFSLQATIFISHLSNDSLMAKSRVYLGHLLVLRPEFYPLVPLSSERKDKKELEFYLPLPLRISIFLSTSQRRERGYKPFQVTVQCEK